MAEQETNELMNLVPDFSEAQNFAPWAPRTMLYTVKAIKGFKAKSSGLPMIKWTFECQEDFKYPDPEDPKHQLSTKGRKIFRNTPAKGEGASFLKEVLKGLKYAPEKFRLPDSSLELVNRKIYITDTLETGDDGVPRNKPKSYKPAV